MARPPKSNPQAERESRASWLALAMKTLANSGVHAVRVEPLARALGVTKGSFYWHFASRRALLDAVLADWENRQTHLIMGDVEAKGGSATEKLTALWRRASAEPVDSSDAEFAIRDWARHDPEVAKVVRRVDRTRMQFLRALFTLAGHEPLQVESRSFLLYSLLVGDYFIQVRHPTGGRAAVLDQCLALLGVPSPVTP